MRAHNIVDVGGRATVERMCENGRALAILENVN